MPTFSPESLPPYIPRQDMTEVMHQLHLSLAPSQHRSLPEGISCLKVLLEIMQLREALEFYRLSSPEVVAADAGETARKALYGHVK